MTRHQPQTRRDAGFSLIELMTVVVLIGIMASMAGPSMQGYVARQKTRGALDRVTADIGFARLHAVERAQRTWVKVSEAGLLTVETVGADGALTTVKRTDLAAEFGGLTIPNAAELEFTSRGLLSNLTGEATIYVAAGGVEDHLLVSMSGRVYRAY
jgi:prepilin-type N-terminal cleavage/methylation domain-containing protein